MFEHLVSEVMIMDQKKAYRDDDCISSDMKPVRVKAPIMGRLLPALGDKMINLGLKLKGSTYSSINAEKAQAPNYLIML